MDEDKTRILFLEPDFLEEMNSYRLTREFTDMELICKNGVVMAHVALVATRSSLLNNVTTGLQHGYDEKILFLPDFDVAIVNTVIQLLYLGHATVTRDDRHVSEINSLISSLDLKLGSIDISEQPENEYIDRNANDCPEDKKRCSKCPNVHFTHKRGMLRHHHLYHGIDTLTNQWVEEQVLLEDEYNEDLQTCVDENLQGKTSANEGINCLDEIIKSEDFQNGNNGFRIEDERYYTVSGMKNEDLKTVSNGFNIKDKHDRIVGGGLDEIMVDEDVETIEIDNPFSNIYNGQFNKSINDLTTCEMCSFVIKKNGISNHFHKKHPDHFIFPSEAQHYRLNFGTAKRVKLKGKLEEVWSCITCNKDIKRNYIKQHCNYHSKLKKFKCMYCEKEFVSQSNLSEHCSRHHGSNCRGVCPICGKIFKLDSDLKKHLDIQHEPERYKCKICPKKFRTKLNYNDHLRSHTGEKPFFCDVCGKSFGRRATLNIHIRIHTGEKRYKCSDCNQAFNNSSHRLRHRREVHLGIKRQTLEYKELSDANQANNYTGKRMKIKVRKNRRNYRKLTVTGNVQEQSERQPNKDLSIVFPKQDNMELSIPKERIQMREKKTKKMKCDVLQYSRGKLDVVGSSIKRNSVSVFTTAQSDSIEHENIKLGSQNNEVIIAASKELKPVRIRMCDTNILKNWDFVILGEEEVETA